MLHDTLNRLEKIIKNSDKLSVAKKQELEKLAVELRKELAKLEKTDREHAHSIAGFTKLTAHEALRQQRDEKLLQHAYGGLQESIRKFEATHPNLTRVLQQICASFGV